MTMPSGRKRTAGKQSSELKRERMELRVAASAKQLIGQAMAVSGLTAGDLHMKERVACSMTISAGFSPAATASCSPCGC